MSTRYAIRHELAFRYDAPVRRAVMTVFLQPMRDQHQILRHFAIRTSPGGPVFSFEGPFGNAGHFFNRPRAEGRLAIRAQAVVEVTSPPPLPQRLPDSASQSSNGNRNDSERQLMLQPSRFARPESPALARFLAEHGVERRADPLRTVRELRSALYRAFRYSPGSTSVESPIDHILASGQGVCQDYAHVMVSTLRRWSFPARYVSGYLAPASPTDVAPTADDDPTQSAASSQQSHAWVECWLPGFGWRGFDPANDCDCDERHIRVAVGRDYADVPPVRGVFSGTASSVLDTVVEVTQDPL